MNFKYHLLVGVAAEIVCPSQGLMLLGCIWPDLSLIGNEYRIRRQAIEFDPLGVDAFSFHLYHFCHSLWVSLFLFLMMPRLGYAHLLHIIPDWFTHTGRFSAMPLYPLSGYRIKFGREVLK
jgi:hypothetical protein